MAQNVVQIVKVSNGWLAVYALKQTETYAPTIDGILNVAHELILEYEAAEKAVEEANAKAATPAPIVSPAEFMEQRNKRR